MKFKILYKLAISALCLAYLATVPMLAYAQETNTDDRWQFKTAIYLWAAGVESTTRRGNEIDVSFSDIVSDLDMAFMGTFVARKSKWSLAADVIYLDIETDKTGTIGSTSIPVNANAEVTGWILNFHGARTVFQVERARVDILVGARYLDLDSTLKLRLGASGPTPTASASASVWDGVIGVKGDVNITPKWYLLYYFDVGTGQSDLTWQGLGGVGYRFKRVNVILVYRYIQWDFKSDSPLNDTNFSGPAFGGRVQILKFGWRIEA